MVCAAVLLPQLEVRPVPAVLGQPVELVVDGARRVEIVVTLPDGVTRDLGPTDERGVLRFVPTALGQHVFATTIADVRVLAPFAVVSPSPLGWWGFATVPVALWLLWRELSARARDRRAT